MKKIRIITTLALFLLVALLIAVTVLAVYGSVTGTILDFQFAKLTNFFDVSAEKVIMLLITGVLALWENGLSKLLNLLKNTAQLSDREAHIFVSVIMFMLSAIVLLVTNTMKLEGMNFTLSNLTVLFAEVYAFTQLAYKKYLKAK